MKKAAVALIFNEKGKILSVSRKYDHNDMGLPGGKVDPGEDYDQAVIREVLEETGLRVRILRVLFEKEDGESLARTFLCEIIGNTPTEFNDPPESGRVAWVDWDDLIRGSFGEYNRSLYFDMLAKKLLP